MIGSIIGGVINAGASIYGAYKSAQANNQAQETLANQHNDNQRYYNTMLAQDYIQRTDNQSVLNKTRELLSEAYSKARARNIVAGGTDESLALQQEGANRAIAETMSGIASNASAHKDAISQQKLAENQQYAGQQAQLQMQRGQNIAQAASSLAKVGSSMMGNDSNTLGQDKEAWSFLFKGKQA